MALSSGVGLHFALDYLGRAQQPGQMLLDVVRREAHRLLRPRLRLKDAQGGPYAVSRIQPVIRHKARRLAQEREETLCDLASDLWA